jgi:hypothetical protein
MIAEQNVLKHAPGRTDADLYLWLMDQQLCDGDASAPAKQNRGSRASNKGFGRTRWGDTFGQTVQEAVQRLQMRS